MLIYLIAVNKLVRGPILLQSPSLGFAGMVAVLQWHHNERDGISNHQHIDCLLYRCSCADKKDQSSASLVVVRGIHRWPMNSPIKRPVTRKMIPFDHVTMGMRHSFEITDVTYVCLNTSNIICLHFGHSCIQHLVTVLHVVGCLKLVVFISVCIPTKKYFYIPWSI